MPCSSTSSDGYTTLWKGIETQGLSGRSFLLLGNALADNLARREVASMMRTDKLALVIPALNEEAALHCLLAELPCNFTQWVIVVDNGSTDATAAVAQDAAAGRAYG